MTGKIHEVTHSPIVRAIALAEAGTTGEIRVHLSKKWFEKDPFGRAQKLFREFGMERTTQRNAVLIYLNLRKKKFAIIGDVGIHQAVGQSFWETLAATLRENLRSTHPENAVALTIEKLGETLRRHFPADLDAHLDKNVLTDITEDDR